MKAILLLSALCVALLAMLFLRSHRAGAQLAAAQSAGLAWSNQWSEAQLKLNHQERVNGVLHTQVAERDTRLAAASNALAQAETNLTSARVDLQAARAALPPALARGAALAAERDGFSNRVRELEAALGDHERALGESRARAARLATELAALSHRLAEAQGERARLEQLLTDPQALQACLARARQPAATNATRTRTGGLDFRQPLTLRADGSVALLPATNSPAR
jgi:chromosome segregation ATPase